MIKKGIQSIFCLASYAPKQIIRNIKVALLLLTFTTLQVYATEAYSQETKLNFSKSKIPVKELLAEIESQTDYLFVYNKDDVDLQRVVSVVQSDMTVKVALETAFKGTKISYAFRGSNIILTKAASSLQQQKRLTVKGTVVDSKGEAIIGASVLEKGTSNGTMTGISGEFKLEVVSNSRLDITYVGYKPMTVSLNGKQDIRIQMEEDSRTLETVVITAMGLKKKEASLTYSTQQVGGNELVRAKDANLINALAGKTAGVVINRSASGLGGSAKVSIRGNRSISGNNQPLYVIDGVPMLNTSNEQASTIMGGTNDAGNRDGGDGISNLNPDDIESMSILKGASAAALYGSQAANGVILITTKKGKAGLQKVTFSSNTTFENTLILPKFQNSYGMDGNKSSWGAQASLTDYDNPGKFFDTGLTTINSVSFTRGNESLQTYFSYANTYGKGILKENSLKKHNLNYRLTANFFNNRLTLDGNVNAMMQTIENRPATGGFYMNSLVGLYGFPRGVDMEPYRSGFEKMDAERNLPVQNWYSEISGFEQNPYWIRNRITSDDRRYRTIAGLSANVKITDWFSMQARGTADYISDKYKQRMYASTTIELAGSYTPAGSSKSYANGRFIHLDHSEYLLYGDIMAMFNKSWKNWAVTGAVGTSLNTTRVNSTRIDSGTASLYYPNVFTISNVVMSSNARINEDINNRRELQSVFGTAQIGWKESIYLDLTARNDWSSTLAFTEKKSFFYPSIGLSWIMNKQLALPEWISFGKVRGSWSKVGNDLPLFYSRLEDHITAGGGIQTNDKAPFANLKPELSSSVEFGTEWKFFGQRLDIDFTYYKTSTKNQLLTLPAPIGATHKYYMINAGKIDNEGVEITLGGTPLMNENFRWKTGINYSKNKNKIVKLHPELTSFLYGDEGFSMNYAMRLYEGGSFGDLYGWKFDRDENGKIKLNGAGLPLTIGSGNTEKVGNCMPDYMLGWSNTFTYKDFSLYFLIDARIGGDVFSQTQAELDYRGVSKNTGEARDRGFVEIGGQKFQDVNALYSQIGARNSTVTEYYMYSATNVRMREVSLGYSLPKKLLEKTRTIKGADVSLIARNLFFFSKKAPFDPDAVMSTDNTCQGVDVFGMPTTRSIGFNLKFTF